MTEFFSIAGRFRLIQALEVRILRILAPLNSRIFSLRTGFVIPIPRLRQISFYKLVISHTLQ
jgi:hypothetical protein